MPSDNDCMRQVFKLAEKGKGKTSPNPMVGAVLVKNGEIVGEGFHQGFGMPHAEIEGLTCAGDKAEGSTLYINLEPCCHYGKTPPCSKALIDAGVKKVVVSILDPNPQVNGKGIQELRAAGIQVEVGVLEQEAKQLNEVFLKWIVKKQPFILLKAALTLNGKMADMDGDSKWITGEKAREKAREMRGWYDAVLVGIKTVLKDDPLLTCRTPGLKNPVRIALDTRLKIPLDSKLVKTVGEAPFWVATCHPDPDKVEKLQKAGVKVILLSEEEEGKVSLRALSEYLGACQISSLFVEGGAEVLGGFLKERLVDKIIFFMAPKLISDSGLGVFQKWRENSIRQALILKNLAVSQIEQDVLIQGYPEF
jgi:diaminohydroxyphosphoribosylaminopyrimidine deaminase/5-amino-6-(5-phosphoribosylamino)uracil reductase